MAPGKLALCGAAALGAFALLGRDAAFTQPPAGQQGALRGSSASTPADKAPLQSKYSALSQPKEAVAAEEPADMASSFLRTALAVLAALAVAIAPMADAQAARSGGRMGGGGARMGGGMGGGPTRMAPRAAPQARSNTNVNIGVAPSIIAPSPFGFSPFGFGFGMPFFPPPLFGPTIALGGGSSAMDQQLENQQRQDERVIDQQKNQIEQMQKELAELKSQQK